MRGLPSFLTREKQLGKYRTGIVICSAEQDVIRKVVPVLTQDFPNTRFIFVAAQAYAGLFPTNEEILPLEGLKASPLRSIAQLRKRRFDLCVLLSSGRPTYRKTKFAGLLLNARRVLLYNENADSMIFDQAHWRRLLKHLAHRWTRRGPQHVLFPLGFLHLLIRTLWLNTQVGWRSLGATRGREGGHFKGNACREVAADVRPCPMCKIPAHTDGFIGTLDKTVGCELSADRFDLTYCACGELIYISPLPTDNDFRTMYVSSTQFNDAGKGAKYRDQTFVKAALEYYGGRVNAMLADLRVDRQKNCNFLEIGAGLSWICRAAKDIDSNHRTVAQDVSPEVAQDCPWVDHYLVTDITDGAIDQHGPFDVISMTHVIEHLSDPCRVLRRSKELLSKKGIIFITAPYRPIGWLLGERSLDKWKSYSYNHVPHHLQYFSRQALRKTAEMTGLRLVYWDDRHDHCQAFEAWLQR